MTASELTHAPAVASPPLSQAYAACRAIARREAKNFYYAFLALPAAKRNAICAVYAFMRHADDLADDESQSREARLERMQQWMEQWEQAVAIGESADPVFVALNDARQRFQIPLVHLRKLVEGTAMDLTLERGREPYTYATFSELYNYCYMVASVVGLVCICIFGYTDKRAEKLAEELGIAFQLTNILRDIREDAERGRLYLPLEDLAAHDVPLTVLAGPQNHFPGAPYTKPVHTLLAFEASRAESFYASGRTLLPMVDADSRPALRVLISIYHSLLRRIVRADYDVFAERIRVPAYWKVGTLIIGLLGVLRARIFAAR